MPFGYNGKILHVDLTKTKLDVETPSESFYRTYMGGSAMGLYYILNEMPAKADALGPENVLTLMTGVTTGAAISGQSRVNANAKSPISGGIGDSQGGGFFPAELKFSGFDGIVIKGKASRPVYLLLKDGTAELKDAAHLAGKLTGEVESIIKQELGDDKVEVLQHGPAAENGVLFAGYQGVGTRGRRLIDGEKSIKIKASVLSTKLNIVADAKPAISGQFMGSRASTRVSSSSPWRRSSRLLKTKSTWSKAMPWWPSLHTESRSPIA